MSVKPSSRRAYIEHVISGVARSQMERILECYIMHDPQLLTRNQVEKITGIRINAVTGRVNVLIHPDPNDKEIQGPLRVVDHGPCPVSKSKRVELIGVNWPVEETRAEQMEMRI